MLFFQQIVGRACGHVITKISRMGRLPNFLTHGAPLRALGAPLTLLLRGFLVLFLYFSILLKSLSGIERQWSREKFAILSLTTRSHVRILKYIERGLLKMFEWNKLPLLLTRIEGPDPAFLLLFHKNLASRFIAFPNIVVFRCPRFGESRFLSSSRIPYPVNVSRIPRCILVKSRIPGKPFQD